MVPAGRPRPFFHHIVVALAAVCGIGLTWWLWHEAGAHEQQRREVEFERLVDARHALIRETLRGYEDSLLALRLLFTYDETVNRAEFAAAVQQQLERHPGFLGVQWAPAVSAAERPVWEKAHAAEIGATIRERVRGRGDLPASRRDMYYPILFAEPLQTNRQVLGSDVAASPMRSDIEQARTSGACVISSLIDLVYESGPTEGVIMICPVSPPPNTMGHAHANAGVLLGVFRIADLLTQPWNRAPGRRLDVMFLDESSTLPDRRLLYCYALHGGMAPTEAQFRTGPHREIPLFIAGRKWSILYRNAGDDSSADVASSPLGVLVSGLVITGLGVGYLASRLRRTAAVESEVRERTAELTESRRQLASLMHALPGMAYRCRYEKSLTVIYASEGALALTGWDAETFMSGAAQFRDCIHADDVERVREMTRAALRERRDLEVEFRICTRDGTEKWLLSRGRGVYLDDGRLEFLEGLVIDITAQKRAEHEHLALERRLLEGQKLESLGLLAGGIAHDFNNLLATIVGNSNLLRLELPAGAPLHRKLDAIENAAQRAADLCRQMLAYAGKGRFVIEPVDLSALVQSLIPLVEVSVAARAQMRLALARDLPAVRVDATQLRQIVMNLVLNAADAIGERGGEIAIATGVSRADAAMLRACPVGADLPPGDYVFLEVRDNGCGMAPEVRVKIFDPFFTTKFAGRGLGLAATLGIVRSHGGALHVETTSGAGSTFRLLLPAATGITIVKPPPVTLSGDWKFTGRALVIDDEEPVRIIAAGMMKSIGASVHMVGDGQSAIDAVRSNPAEFAVVLLDLLMPELSGEQTLKVLRSIRPDLRVLIISGFSETDVMQRLAHDQGPFKFLHKPFTRVTLIAALRELLA